MTSKLKCPFCGKELKDQWVGQNVAHEYFDCPKCKMNGNPKLWQALTQAKQDLEVARKALNDAKQTLFYCWDTYDIHSAKCTAEDVEKALEQIEHKEVK